MQRAAFRLLPLALSALALTACPKPAPPTQDTVPPTVKSLAPEDGAMMLSTATIMTVVFSEEVSADSVQVELLQGTTNVEGALTVEGDTATFTPAAALRENATFTFTVKAYEDPAGNAGEPASTTFTTANSIPVVTLTTPADGAINVAPGTTLSAQFSKAMDPATLNDTTFLVLEGTTPIPGTVTYSDAERLATFTPSKPLFESRLISVTLTTDVTDAAGTHLDAAKQWSFTTSATVPTVTSITPADAAMDVAGNAPVTVVFSEDMDPATLTDQSFQVGIVGGAAIAGSYTWDAPSRTATFQPDGAYPGGVTIAVKLTPAVKDISGIALAMDVTSAFTVSNAPAVSSSSPAPNDTGVSLFTDVSLGFSQAMDPTTLSAANIRLEDDAQQAVAATYVPGATTLTLTPDAPLTESTVYSVIVSTAVKSATGVPFAAEYRFDFTTLGIAPQVVAVTPSAGAVDVPVNSKVTLTFNEDMNTATFTTANVRLSNGATDVVGTVTAIDARNVRLTPSSALSETTAYTIIAGTGLTDARGNALGSEFRTTFTTEPLPRIVSISPAPGSTNVPNGAAVVLVANKALDASTVTVTPPTGTPKATFTLYQEGAVIEAAVQYDPATRSIRLTRTSIGAPANWTSGKRYTVIVDGSKLKDPSGNVMGGVLSTTFVAGAAADTSAPTVTAIDPQQGQVGVARTARPYATFSEGLDPTSLSTTNVSITQAGTPVAGRIEYVQDQNKVVFIPTGPLAADTQFSWTIGTGIKDLSGNAKTANNTVVFTTQSNAEPTLAASSPADAATNVNVNVAVRLAFSEPIDATTLVVEVSEGAAAIAGTLTYDEGTASAVFKPAADLPGGKTITVTVKGGLKDKEGLATTAELVRTFGTVANSSKDITAPTLSATVPAANAMGVSSRPALQLTFSEAMDPASISFAQFVIEEQGGSTVPFGVSYLVQSDTATLTPSAALKPGATYDVKVLGGPMDLAGNALDAMAASATFSFTVDATKPTITSRSPAPGSTVGSSAGVELVFSEDMNAQTIDAASVKLSVGGNEVLATVWYDASGRTAFLRPATKLADGAYTVTVDGLRAADLAGNTVADSFNFTVSSLGPSVVSASPCGTVVDADALGTTGVAVTFDPGVKKAGGGGLDSSAVQLRIGTTQVATTVAHAAGQTVATLTPSAALLQDTTYEVLVVASQVQDNVTSAAMASNYSCTFRTQRIIFADDMDPIPASMWVANASGSNQWKALNSVSDPMNSTVVWRGSNANDGQNYVRNCVTIGNGASQSVVLERDVTLPNLSRLLLRLDEWHAIAGTDSGSVSIVFGGSPKTIATYTGGGALSYQPKEYDISAYKNATVKLRFTLAIAGGNNLGGSCPAGDKGLYVDNLRIVGE